MVVSLSLIFGLRAGDVLRPAVYVYVIFLKIAGNDVIQRQCKVERYM